MILLQPDDMEGGVMGIDPERQINASVVLERIVYDKIKEIAKRDRRSISNLMSIWLEDRLRHELSKVCPEEPV